jgi:hypothetical protein
MVSFISNSMECVRSTVTNILVKRHHVTETLTISLLIFPENINLKAEVSTQYFDDDTVY